jgi:hypothetical protein
MVDRRKCVVEVIPATRGPTLISIYLYSSSGKRSTCSPIFHEKSQTAIGNWASALNIRVTTLRSVGLPVNWKALVRDARLSGTVKINRRWG